MLAAEWGVGQMLWSILWFFLFFLWIWLVISIFADIIRSKDMGGWGKALWSFFIIFVPYLGVFIYLIVRGGGMAERNVQQMQRQEEQFRTYVQDAAGSGGTSTAQELATLADLHERGKLTDDEYAALKAKALS